MLDFPLGPITKLDTPSKPPTIMPNKFEYRRYAETDTTYPDLSEELRKK